MKNLNTITISEENPFEHCKLAREPYADVLTDIVKTNADGFVMAIDNKWGAGKTTFVSMWNQKLKNEGYQTLYFNAWENDFENNPFVAITAELRELLKNETSPTFKEVLKKGSKISQAVIPSIMKAVLKRYAGDEVAEIMSDYSKGVLDAFEEDVDAYIDRKKTMSDFRDELQKYIQENSNGKPIVFIVDELDRCRPNYAVSVLENIKHLFSVKGIVFVLSIDKEQLGHAICGAYGSDNIDANEYLRRFIDVEYSLPEPLIVNYIGFLLESFKLNEFLNLANRKTQELTVEKNNFIDFACFLFKFKGLNLRQQEKIMTHVSITLQSFKSNAYILPDLLLYLIYLRLFETDFYNQIKRKAYTHQQLLNKNGEILSGNLNEDNGNWWRIKIESILISCYNEYVDSGDKIRLKLNFAEKLRFKSSFDREPDQVLFTHFVQSETDNYKRSTPSIEYLMKKIDLMEPLKEIK